MELHGPEETEIVFEKSPDGLIVSFKTGATEHLESLYRDRIITQAGDSHKFLIKEDGLYEITKDGLRSEGMLVDIIDDVLAIGGSSCADQEVYGNIIYDLLHDRLDWIPPGYYYFSSTMFFVFPTRETLQEGIEADRVRLESYKRGEGEYYPDAWYDKMDELAAYWFNLPTTGSAYSVYDIKKHFRQATAD